MKIVSPKLILLAAGIITSFILFSLAQEMNRRLQIQREVAILDEEVRELEKNIVEMSNLNQYFRTEAFQEKMAREKLNYRAPGEEVVLISEESLAEAQEESSEELAPVYSVPTRWWRAFFVEPFDKTAA